MVALVDVAGQQAGGIGVGAADEHGGHVQHVGGQPGGDQVLDRLLRGNEDFASHVAALLVGRVLVLEMDARSPGLDHGLHQLEGVQHAAEAGLGVGHDRGVPLGHLVADPREPRDLVRPLEGLVDAIDQRGNAVGRIEALVGIGLVGGVHVGGDLPTADVDRLQPGLDLLHGLGPGLGPQGADVGLGVQETPEPLRPQVGQRVLHLDAAAEANHVGRRIRPMIPSHRGLVPQSSCNADTSGFLKVGTPSV